ncbi:MAG: DMT family transporter [Deltaproteobacteria bacterium]|jgi:drug/metabolite transporter (DMT)-like permease|nr:DMT family transporter [Deltaproteobacteria bacterium]
MAFFCVYFKEVNCYQKNVLAVVAAAATGVQVGSAIVATRFVIDQTDPVTLGFLRYLIGFCLLLIPAWRASREWFSRRDMLPIAALGITQFGILIVLMNYGLQFIPSARAALIFATVPLLTMTLGALIGYERMTVLKTVGVLLTIVGVGFALGEKVLLPGATGVGWIGELAVLASALCAAVCSVLYRPYLIKYPTLQVSAFAMLASVGFLAVAAGLEGSFGSSFHFTLAGWLAVLFIGASSAIGYYMWLWALSHTSPTRVTVFLSLSPITSAALGALLLAEPISVFFIAGLISVILGLYLAHRPQR